VKERKSINRTMQRNARSWMEYKKREELSSIGASLYGAGAGIFSERGRGDQ